VSAIPWSQTNTFYIDDVADTTSAPSDSANLNVNDELACGGYQLWWRHAAQPASDSYAASQIGNAAGSLNDGYRHGKLS